MRKKETGCALFHSLKAMDCHPVIDPSVTTLQCCPLMDGHQHRFPDIRGINAPVRLRDGGGWLHIVIAELRGE